MVHDLHLLNREHISIHALREERDSTSRIFASMIGSNFNPRAPRGARLKMQTGSSEPPAISIHALREERDPTSPGFIHGLKIFQSTRSARSATAKKHKTEEYFL